MKVTVLIEDTTNAPEIIAEHGLSLYIETSKHRILFDMGKSDAYAENAARLGVDLAGVDVAVLSHGHYDHGGGLKRFLEINGTAPVYVSSRAFEPRYSVSGKYNGLSCDLIGNDRLVYVEDSLDLDEELSLFSCNERERPYRAEDFGQTVKVGDQFLPDLFLHEQYLLIKEGEKRMLVSGCTHKGILNVTEWFSPDVLVGGFHFHRIDPNGEGRKVLEASARLLLRHRTKYYTCHCTGTEQYSVLKEIMGDRLKYLSSGMIVEI